MLFFLLPLALSGSLVIAAVSNAQTSLTLLCQNNLNGTDDENHIGFILLDPTTKEEAPGLCTAIGESLISSSEIKEYSADFVHSFTYLAYARRALQVQQYSISDGVATFAESDGEISFQPYPSGNPKLPVLCTQSSNQDQPGNTVATARNKVTITSTGNTFKYSTLYSPKGQTLNATIYAPECPQYGSGAESCLFLNIQAPYLPKQGSNADPRPLFFWIHGGFVTGSAFDPGIDGGNLASREDLVVVQIQYRLATLGFLAIPGTNIKGNFGIADQITALQWVIENIASFGGDPNQITIGGDSAGAGSVRTLLGSPPANRKFQGAIAMSNLGGDVDLDQSGGYSTTYSSYLTISESYAIARQNILEAAGCNQTTLDAQITCLEVFPASILGGLPDIARYVVQDGTYVNTEQLDVRNHNGSTAFVPVMFGVCHDDGASIGASYPRTPVTTEVAGIEASLRISAFYAQSIIDSGLFPLYNTGNLTLDSFNISARITTDIGFRCVDEATMYAAFQSGAFATSYFYQMQRTIGGYDPNGLGGPPATPGYPNGNPNLPYFRFHSGATAAFIFGNVSPIRDQDDLYAAQLNSGYFSQSVKDGQPNPSETYLEKRHYVKTLEAVKQTGSWMNIRDKDGPIRLLDYPSVESGFVDVPQCAFLNYSLSYYLDGGL